MTKNKFRNDRNTRFLNALVIETCVDSTDNALYTLKDEDHNGYVSLYQAYMKMADLTEFYFAQAHFENYEHWTMFAEAAQFKTHVARWRQELELKIRADALIQLQAISENKDDKNSYQANKFLLTGDWRGPQRAKDSVGRPSKAKIKEAAQELFEGQQTVDEEYERLFN